MPWNPTKFDFQAKFESSDVKKRRQRTDQWRISVICQCSMEICFVSSDNVLSHLAIYYILYFLSCMHHLQRRTARLSCQKIHLNKVIHLFKQKRTVFITRNCPYLNNFPLKNIIEMSFRRLQPFSSSKWQTLYANPVTIWKG